jgi:N-acetylmuramic acid 6-phosphate etherase
VVTREPLSSATADQLDLLRTDEVVEILLRAEERVVTAVRAAAPAIAEAAELLAACIRDGGRAIFIGAGTSGRLAIAEAAELPGTFGLPSARCIGVMAAGGRDAGLAGGDYDEDDADSAARDVAALNLTPQDVVVAVAASGHTPYTVAAARAAHTTHTPVIAVVTAPSSPLAELAVVAIEVIVGEEALRGSTRLSAGTAQKIALNALTTAAMARAGRVHGDLMIDVVAANAKLRERLTGIVAEISQRPLHEAEATLQVCDWNGRAAVLCLVAGLEPAEAATRAAAYPSLREAISAETHDRELR